MPTPQLIEILAYAPAEEHPAIRELIDKRFRIVPVDELTALKCAELLYESFNSKEIQELRDGVIVTKARIKYDCMLVATAIVRHVSRIYSEDPHFKKFANGRIDVLEMPNIGVQANLFDS